MDVLKKAARAIGKEGEKGDDVEGATRVTRAKSAVVGKEDIKTGRKQVLKACSELGCNTKAKGKGKCRKHGAYGVCTTAGCNTNAHSKGLCAKHGAYGECTVSGCSTAAQPSGFNSGKCGKHGGGTQKICGTVGCSTKAVARGHCWKHGGGSQTICAEEGCATKANARGLCAKHGGNNRPNKGTRDKKLQCTYPGCKEKEHFELLCKGHLYGNCGVAGCTNHAMDKGGLCTKHVKDCPPPPTMEPPA